MNKHNSVSRRLLRGLAVGLAGMSLALAVWTPFRTEASDEIVIKLGTLAPAGTPWYKSLRAMGDEWAKLSNGKVKLKIYEGGVSGNEGGIIRKIRINQLQAGTVSATGLIDIERSSLALQTPMVIDTYAELDYIRDKMTPLLNKRLEDKGFKVLTWGDAGWIHFFTKSEVTTVAQLKKLKLWSWEGDPASTEAFSKVGLTPVTISANDVLPALQTGMVEGFPQTSLAALSLQWFGLSKNMVDVNWAPMVGATIVSAKAWSAIPADLQPKLLQVAMNQGVALRQEVRKLDANAVTEMQKLGLKVVKPANMAEWEAFAKSFQPAMRGTVMVADAMDQVLALHKEFEAKAKPSAPAPAAPATKK